MVYNTFFLISDIITAIFLTLLLLKEFKRFLKDKRLIHLIYFLFYVLYCYPLVYLAFSYGYEYEYFVFYNTSMSDAFSRVLTDLIVCCLAVLICHVGKNKKRSFLTNYIKIDSPLYKIILLFLISVPIFYTIITGTFFSFLKYAAISQSTRVGNISSVYSLVFNYSLVSLFLSGLYLVTNKRVSIAESLLVLFLMAVISFMNGKRYILIFTIIILFMTLIINNKISTKGFVVLGAIIVLSLVGYIFVYMTFFKSSGYNKIDLFESLYVDLSRYDRLNSVIYASLYPDNIQFLEYSGQTVLANVFFFIPRRFWPEKGYQYQYYYSFSVHFPRSTAYSYEYLRSYWTAKGVSGITTNIVDELVCNFGFFGLIPIYVIIRFFKKLLDREGLMQYTSFFLFVYSLVFSLEPVVVFAVLVIVFLANKVLCMKGVRTNECPFNFRLICKN